jgi:hypothetical protein
MPRCGQPTEKGTKCRISVSRVGEHCRYHQPTEIIARSDSGTIAYKKLSKTQKLKSQEIVADIKDKLQEKIKNRILESPITQKIELPFAPWIPSENEVQREIVSPISSEQDLKNLQNAKKMEPLTKYPFIGDVTYKCPTEEGTIPSRWYRKKQQGPIGSGAFAEIYVVCPETKEKEKEVCWYIAKRGLWREAILTFIASQKGIAPSLADVYWCPQTISVPQAQTKPKIIQVDAWWAQTRILGRTLWSHVNTYLAKWSQSLQHVSEVKQELLHLWKDTERVAIGLHDLNIQHNDLHAKNILVDSNDRKLWLIDFGYATIQPQENGNYPDPEMKRDKRFQISHNKWRKQLMQYYKIQKFDYDLENPLDNFRQFLAMWGTVLDYFIFGSRTLAQIQKEPKRNNFGKILAVVFNEFFSSKRISYNKNKISSFWNETTIFLNWILEQKFLSPSFRKTQLERKIQEAEGEIEGPPKMLIHSPDPFSKKSPYWKYLTPSSPFYVFMQPM